MIGVFESSLSAPQRGTCPAASASSVTIRGSSGLTRLNAFIALIDIFTVSGGPNSVT